MQAIGPCRPVQTNRAMQAGPGHSGHRAVQAIQAIGLVQAIQAIGLVQANRAIQARTFAGLVIQARLQPQFLWSRRAPALPLAGLAGRLRILLGVMVGVFEDVYHGGERMY